MKITVDMFNALRAITNYRGGQALLAKKCGLPHQHIQKYVTGKVKEITLENWLKLLPHLKPYLKDNYTPKGITQEQIDQLQEISSRSPSMPLDETILLEAYRKLSSDKKSDMIKEAILLAEQEHSKHKMPSGAMLMAAEEQQDYSPHGKPKKSK